MYALLKAVIFNIFFHVISSFVSNTFLNNIWGLLNSSPLFCWIISLIALEKDDDITNNAKCIQNILDYHFDKWYNIKRDLEMKFENDLMWMGNLYNF